jgi:hypothetical protein
MKFQPVKPLILFPIKNRELWMGHTGYGDGSTCNTTGHSGYSGSPYMIKHNFSERITLFFRRIYLYLRGKLKYYAITRGIYFSK